jgi:hypothetical protein
MLRTLRLMFVTVAKRDAPRRGDHRSDILAEVVKLATTHNWYYTIDTIKGGLFFVHMGRKLPPD